MRSIFLGVSNLIEESVSDRKSHGIIFSYPATPINIALVNGKITALPMHLQAPPVFGLTEYEKKLGLTDHHINWATHLFEQAIIRMTKFFPQSKVEIIFIPSPFSSY